MKQLIIKILNSPFIRNVTVLATGTVAAQIISLISSPIITRLYGPDAFGMMGVFMAIVEVFVPIASLTYPIAMVLPKDDRNAKKLGKLSLFVAMCLGLIVFLMLLLFEKPIVRLFQIQEISSYLILVPLVVLFAGFVQVTNQWLIRTKQFGIDAKAAFLQSLIINGSKIGVGLFNPLAVVLIVSSALAKGLRSAIMFALIRKSNYQERHSAEEEQFNIKELAKKHRDFPLYRAPETLINAVSQRVPVLMLTTFFGPAAAGFYTLGNNVLQQPIRLIGKSVGNVFYPRITEAAHNKENLTELIFKATLSLAGVGIIPFGLIILFGPWIFNLIFGNEWITAGQYAQWIGLFLFCEFINKPSVRSLPVLSAQRFHLVFTILTFIVRIAALASGYFILSSDLVAIALFGVSSAIMHLILILLVLRKSREFDRNIFRGEDGKN